MDIDWSNFNQEIIGRERSLSGDGFDCTVLWTSLIIEHPIDNISHTSIVFSLEGVIQQSQIDMLKDSNLTFNSAYRPEAYMVLKYKNVQIPCFLQELNYNVDQINIGSMNDQQIIIPGHASAEIKIAIYLTSMELSSGIIPPLMSETINIKIKKKKILNRFELMDIDL